MNAADALTDAIRFREALPADAEAIAALHAESWRSAYRGIYADAYLEGPVHEDKAAAWRARFATVPDPDLVVVVAEADGAPDLLGLCCILAGHDPRWGSLIDNLHVRPGLTRRRLGVHLLEAAVRRVCAAGRHVATPLHLTVLEGNGRAIAAYEGWGGELAENLTSLGLDGHERPIRRYAWPSPAALLASLSIT